MLRLRPDDMHQIEPLLLEGFGHDVGRLLLRIDFAGVGHGGTVPQIVGPVRAVVQVIKLDLPPRGSERDLVEDLGKGGSFREAGAGIGRRPAIGIVDGQVPGRGTSHRKTANDNAIVVDAIPRPDGIERLEGVDFAGELVGVAIPSVGMQDDRVGRRESSDVPFPIPQEVHLAQRFAPAVEPEIEPKFAVALLRVRLGDHETVRLHRSVESRNITAHDQPVLRRPGCFSFLECPRSGKAFVEQGLRRADFVGFEEFVIGQRRVHRVPINDDVGKECLNFLGLRR